jgi:hypothetical protein
MFGYVMLLRQGVAQIEAALEEWRQRVKRKIFSPPRTF